MSLSYLSGLTNLTELYINADVAGGDLSALSGLTELRTVSIYHFDQDYTNYDQRTLIRDLNPLAGLSNLNSLTVSGAADGIDTSPVSHISQVEIS